MPKITLLLSYVCCGIVFFLSSEVTTVTSQQSWRFTDQSNTFSNYNESCSLVDGSEKKCDYLKFLNCSAEGRCTCKHDPDSKVLYNYDPEKETCVPVPVPGANNNNTATADAPGAEPRVIEVVCQDQHDCWNSHFGEYSRCNQREGECMCWDTETNGQKDVIMVNNRCYILKRRDDDCQTDHECNATITGEAVCVKQTIQGDNTSSISSNLGKCECHPSSFWDNRLQECLKIADTGTEFTCKSDLQCSHPTALGTLARCNEYSRKCECFDINTNGRVPTGELNGKCYLKLKINESCTTDIECKLGSGQPSHCVDDKYNFNVKRCECHDSHVWGETHVEDEEQCLQIGQYQSKCTSDNQCQHQDGLGDLSKCAKYENNPDNGQCICWDPVKQELDTTGFYNGACHYKRGPNERCNSNEQCFVGWSKNAICAEHESYDGEKVCQCPEDTICNSGNYATFVNSKSMLLFITIVWFGFMI